MFLKRLELHGFKSFAPRTELEFDTGVTAIVGPNGSGKSNLADAVRWVLGEQSPRWLRTRRMEDLVFSGSSSRPPTGMAEVTLVLNNEDGRFPLDFQEVAITRRLYRSGESEYLLNKRRVRLREITELLLKGNIGQNGYTILGQGLIENALSLHPQERRALLEEAAGIKGYRIKMEEAEEKLRLTRQNLLRLNDLLHEIAPRLSRLEAQVKETEEQERLRQELTSLLSSWYAYHLRLAHEERERAEHSLIGLHNDLERNQRELSILEKRLEELYQRQRVLRSRLEVSREGLSQVRSLKEDHFRTRALNEERLRELASREEELLQEVEALENELALEKEGIAQDRSREAELVLEVEASAPLLEEIRGELERLKGQRDQLSNELEPAQKTSFTCAASIAEMQNRLAYLVEREHQLSASRSACLEKKGQQRKKLLRTTQTMRTLQRDLEGLTQRRGDVENQWRINRGLEEECRSRVTALQGELAEMQRKHQALSTEMSFFSDRLTGGATKALLEAGVSRGVLGLLQDSLSVPPELEVAIEAALEGHLGAPVIESWQEVEAALAFLHENRVSGATLISLEVASPRAVPTLPGHAGVLGVASKLVKCEPQLGQVLEALLGDVIVVKNLAVARRVVEGSHCRAVTLAGELLRPSGAITLGVQGVLAHRRTISQLAQQRRESEARIRETTSRFAEEQSRLESLSKELAKLEDCLAELSAAHQEKEAALARIRGEVEKIERELAWQEGLERQVEAEERETAEKCAVLQLQMQGAQGHALALQQELSTLETKRAQLEEGYSSLQNEIATALQKQAIAQGAHSNLEALIRRREEAIRRLQGQLARRRERLATLAYERERLSLLVTEAVAGEAVLEAKHKEKEAALAIIERELEELDLREGTLRREETSARSQLLELERGCAQAALELERSRDRLSNLERALQEDGLESPLQAGEPIHATEEGRPPFDVDAVKRRIDRLRSRLKTMGPIHPDTIREYQDTRQRHEFLSSQISDLEETERSLRRAISQLDSMTQRRFEDTFHAVAGEFQSYFGLFFGGGKGRLLLNPGEDSEPAGVEIMAQPPGKRLQGLSLLSGGERTLTALAFLFAILKVSPTPFCILDEADAALDEANIRRFTSALRELARQTQFILITHNRGTIEMADTLYGLSMGEDNTSKLLSIRLESGGVGERERLARGA